MAQPKYVYETTFLVKRGTKEQWEKENPVLECGEIGYVIDENSIKIGDGSSYWTELGYVEDERLSEYGRVTAGQAEGVKLGKKATSEGDQTQATGEASHAEGQRTTASGAYSHAEGNYTTASGRVSHAEGISTIAGSEAQHVSGKFNQVDDDDKYAFIIGNGASDSERNNAFMVQWNGDAKLDGYLDVLGLKGDTVTRNLYVGGARKANGEWQPDGGFVVDHTPLNSTIKNEACISTLKVNEEGNYALTAPNGSNNLYKIQVIEDGSTRTLDINTLPIITAGTYLDGFRYSADNTFVIRFGSKTKIESNTKTFTDGTTCYKRLSYQQSLKYHSDSGEGPYPSVEFSTNGPATIKIWWVAGDANRYFAIQHRYENSGSARLEVTGNFVAHGNAEFNKTAYFDNNVDIHGRLETSDIHVHGFIETSESIECGGSIKVDSEIKAGGTATFENDVKIKNNSNREHTVKLRDALHEALDFDFKKRIPFNASELLHSASWNDLKEQVEALREISATTLTLDEEEYTFEIGDEPIEIWKDFTLKGINEKPVIINFNYTGTASEFTIFKVMAPDLKISFENLVINSKRVNGGYGRKHIIKCDENAINSNLLLNKIELEYGIKIDIYQGNSIYFKESKASPDIWSGSVKNFYAFNDKEEFDEYYEKLTDYINITDNYQGRYSSTEGANCSATDASHAEGVRTTANPTPWYSEGEPYRIGGAHAEGYETQALATPSHAEGYETIVSYVARAGHAEGWKTSALGEADHAEGYQTVASSETKRIQIGDYLCSNERVYGAPCHTEGREAVAELGCSHAEGYKTQALNFASHAEGRNTLVRSYEAQGNNDTTYYKGGGHAEGNGTIVDDSGHTEGQYSWARNTSHAEGIGTFSSQNGAHAEGIGLYTVAYGVNGSGKKFQAKHPNNRECLVVGAIVQRVGHDDFVIIKSINIQDMIYFEFETDQDFGTLEEGQTLIFRMEPGSFDEVGAKGEASHCEGLATVALGDGQHAQGKYNIQDTENKYAHIVGNGTNHKNRSNSHTLDWNGNAWYSGDVYVGSTSGTNKDEGSKKLATEEFVTNALSGVEHPTPDLTGYATEEFVNTTIQQNAYTLPAATAEAIGGVKVGDTLEISADGALNVKQAETPTELYLMSPGGLKFKITVSDVGALSAEQVV